MKNERKEELKDEMKNRISMALKDPTLQQGFEIICKNLKELGKENAELRLLKDVHKVSSSLVSDIAIEKQDQLTKAKKIIKDLLGSENTCCEEEMFFEIRQKAENFLKDSEVEK